MFTLFLQMFCHTDLWRHVKLFSCAYIKSPELLWQTAMDRGEPTEPMVYEQWDTIPGTEKFPLQVYQKCWYLLF